jgi:hypothetical protein
MVSLKRSGRYNDMRSRVRPPPRMVQQPMPIQPQSVAATQPVAITPQVVITVLTEQDVATYNATTGSYILNANLTIPLGTQLNIKDGVTFVVPTGLTITNNDTVNVYGKITNSGGTITNNNAFYIGGKNGYVFNSSNGVINNNGTFVNDAAFQNSGATINNNVGSTLTINNSLLTGDSSVTSIINNYGTTIINTSASFVVRYLQATNKALINNYYSIINYGYILNSQGTITNFTSSSSLIVMFDNYGTVDNDGKNNSKINGASKLVNEQPSGRIINGGTISQ